MGYQKITNLFNNRVTISGAGLNASNQSSKFRTKN